MGSGASLVAPPKNAPLDDQFRFWDELSKTRALTPDESVRFERVIRDIDWSAARRRKMRRG